NDRAAGEAREIEEWMVVEPGALDGGLEAFANHIELALELVRIFDAWAPADEGLEHGRLNSLWAFPKRAVLRVQGAPAEHALALCGNQLLEELLAIELLVAVRGGEKRSDAVFERLGQVDAERAAPAHEQSVRDLDEHAGAVPRVVFAAARAAV